MRYAERGDLLDYILRRGPIPEGQSRIWTKQVALALQYMHELEIAHRDLKCENILITSNFNVKLADFGFSRCVVNNKGLRMLRYGSILMKFCFDDYDNNLFHKFRYYEKLISYTL